jgi:hypothetical protein
MHIVSSQDEDQWHWLCQLHIEQRVSRVQHEQRRLHIVSCRQDSKRHWMRGQRNLLVEFFIDHRASFEFLIACTYKPVPIPVAIEQQQR